jgi:hypothetical protein
MLGLTGLASTGGGVIAMGAMIAVDLWQSGMVDGKEMRSSCSQLATMAIKADDTMENSLEEQEKS